MFTQLVWKPSRRLALIRLARTLYFGKGAVSLGFTEDGLVFQEPHFSWLLHRLTPSFDVIVVWTVNIRNYVLFEPVCPCLRRLTVNSLSKEVASLKGHHGQSPSPANPTTNLSDPANVTTLPTVVASEQNSSTKPIPATPRGQELDRNLTLLCMD